MLYYNFNFNTEPTISLKEVLYFIEYYYFVGIIDKRKFEFDDQVLFLREEDYKRFEIFLQLHLESAINLTIEGQQSDDFGNKNKELDLELKKYYLKEKNTLNGLLGIKSFKRYSIIDLRLNFDDFRKVIKQKDCINIKIQINGMQLLSLLFSKIDEEGYGNIDLEIEVDNLLDFILSQTGGKRNYLEKVTLFYNFSKDYLNNKRLVLPLLVELHNLGKLKMIGIRIDREKDFIYFEIDTITTIEKEDLIKLGNKIIYKQKDEEKIGIKKIEYLKEGIKINSELFEVEDSPKSQCFLNLVSWYLFENPKNKDFSIFELNTFYSDNYKELQKDIENNNGIKFLNLEEKNIKNSYLKTINKATMKKYGEELLEIRRGQIIEKNININN